MARKRREGSGRRWIWLVAAALAGVGALVTFRVGPEPVVGINTALPGIGRRTPVAVTVEEPHRGLGEVRVELIQGQAAHLLESRSHRPRASWQFWGPRTESDLLELEVGSETVPGIEEGSAILRVTAQRAGTWLRRPAPKVTELALPVRLVPPALTVLSSQHYPAQGGSGVVLYRASETAIRDGVVAGEWWFPGYPLPGDAAGRRFALYAVPHDLTDPARIHLVAEDDVRNRSERSFVDRFFPHPLATDVIEVSDRFMAKVVPEILGQTPSLTDQGDLLANYLAINNELRRQNGETLKELGESSLPEFLWRRPFAPMPNAQVMSKFADRRTYVYQGQEVDRQDHLGFDLASVRQAELPAANDGLVVLARYFGIYGNAVILDHGYGLMSLYGHLSSIEVTEGERVVRGQTVGRTGETGLAGGDHLHFTMLVRGLPSNPREWWDAGWIRDRIAGKLDGALVFEP